MTAVPDVLSLVRAAAARGGDRPLLQVGDGSVCARELAARVEAFARSLVAAGMAPGERVVILLPRCLEEAIVLLGVAAAGGIAVPLHGRLKDPQVAHVLRDCEPFAVATSRTRTLALADVGSLLRAQRTVVLGEAIPGVAAASLPPPPDAEALPTPAADSPAVLLYTSGSTGLAKGILQSHRNLALGAAIVAGYLGLTADDHTLALLPFSFDYGLNQLLSALHVGCRITAADHLGTGELAALLARHRPTGLGGVPSLWHEVAAGLAAGTLQPEHGRSLRYVTNSGGALPVADSSVLRRQWPHVQVFAMYGLTEAFRSAFLPPAEFDAFPTSFGRALPGVELLLVDPTTGAVLDGEATGELVHAGALVSLGYWRRPADAAVRFRQDPRPGRDPHTVVVFSGDLVRRDALGRHFFVARSDRLLKVQGHRISPDEVAAEIAGMPGLGEVAVYGEAGGADGHRIVLCVTGDPDDRALRDRLLRRCRARLPSYMQPAVLHVLRELPHNQNGKVDEGALRRLCPPCTGTR